MADQKKVVIPEDLMSEGEILKKLEIEEAINSYGPRPRVFYELRNRIKPLRNVGIPQCEISYNKLEVQLNIEKQVGSIGKLKVIGENDKMQKVGKGLFKNWRQHLKDHLQVGECAPVGQIRRFFNLDTKNMSYNKIIHCFGSNVAEKEGFRVATVPAGNGRNVKVVERFK